MQHPAEPNPLVMTELRVIAPLEGFDEGFVQKTVEAVWRTFEAPEGVRLEVVLLDENAHTRIHEVHLNDPSVTDVMAFPYGDEDLFGEVLINRDMCVREAKERGHSALQEARLYLVHGTLHLLGFRDGSDAERVQMRAAEQQVLEDF